MFSRQKDSCDSSAEIAGDDGKDLWADAVAEASDGRGEGKSNLRSGESHDVEVCVVFV